MNGRKIKIIDGGANTDFAEKLYYFSDDDINLSLSNALVSSFSDGETRVEIEENMRGCDIFVIQSTSPPVNDNLMKLILILDALKRSDCWRVTAVIPYFGYARQDKKLKPRVPISAKAVADIIQTVGVDRILTMDIHSGSIQGFFNCPVDNLFASSIFTEHMEKTFDNNVTVIVSPDVGGVQRAVHYSKKLSMEMAVIHKSRDNPNEVSKMILLGSVRGKTAILVDDISDTSGTLIKAAMILKDAGAKRVMAYVTHGIFSGNAVINLTNSCFDKIYVTDSIPQLDDIPQKRVLSCSKLFASAINNIHSETSVSCLF